MGCQSGRESFCFVVNCRTLPDDHLPAAPAEVATKDMDYGMLCPNVMLCCKCNVLKSVM